MFWLFGLVFVAAALVALAILVVTDQAARRRARDEEFVWYGEFGDGDEEERER